jgi:PAS domain-containing protein
MIADDVVDRAVSITGDRMKPVAVAFLSLARRSWPKPEVVKLFAEAERERHAADICKRLLAAFDNAHAAYPTAMFWWKDEGSHFLGFCPRFASAAGLAASDLLGRNDLDPRVAWSRQGALYMKDDREVLASFTPRFDILERQDREGETTVWLRTSKVPYRAGKVAGTVGGFDTISTVEALELAKRSSKSPS